MRDQSVASLELSGSDDTTLAHQGRLAFGAPIASALRHMKLDNVVVADPAEASAASIARACDGFAANTATARTGNDVVALCTALRPEMLIIALELRDVDALQAIRRVRAVLPSLVVVATFRELAASALGRLRKAGVEDLLPQPVDASSLARIVWQRFEISTRRHPRYAVALEIRRADGVVLGRTRNVSEGGMLMDAAHPVASGDSLLVDVLLPDGPLRVRARVLAAEGEVPRPMWARLEFESLRGREHRRMLDFLDRLRAGKTRAQSQTDST